LAAAWEPGIFIEEGFSTPEVNNIDLVEKEMAKIVAAALDGVVVEQQAGVAHSDLVVRTRDGRSIVLEAKWAGKGWPQDVHRAAVDVPERWPRNVVIVAHRLSPGAIEWLRERDANWADGAGQARIFGPDGLIVVREPTRASRRPPPTRTFRWSSSALSIAEAILASSHMTLRTVDVAQAAGWSIAQAANVLSAFDRQGWTRKHGPERGPGARRELLDPDGLLGAWSTGVRGVPRPTRIAHRATDDPMELLRAQLMPALEHDVEWAVSGWAGLELAAPYATATPTVHVYVVERDFAGRLSIVMERAGLREVDEGGRVIFWAADARALRLSMRCGGIPVASAPRLYADLLSFGGRGSDAAVHVKEALLDPLHAVGGESADG